MISNFIVAITGKTGCGKSFLMNYLIHKEYEKKNRQGIVVLDFRGDHLNLLHKKDFFYLRISSSLFNKYRFNWTGIFEKYPYLIIEPFKLTVDEYQKLGNEISLGILEVKNRVFFLEEAHLCFPVYTSLLKGFGILVTTGRKLGIDFYFLCQRASTINTTAVAEANIRICFQQDEKNDLFRMQPYFSIPLSELKRFEFVAKNTFSHQEIVSNTNDLKKIDIIFEKQSYEK